MKKMLSTYIILSVAALCTYVFTYGAHDAANQPKVSLEALVKAETACTQLKKESEDAQINAETAAQQLKKAHENSNDGLEQAYKNSDDAGKKALDAHKKHSDALEEYEKIKATFKKQTESI